MYVCVCRGVTDSQIRAAVNAGARSVRDLRIALGVCSSCGRCGTHAREVLQQVVADDAPDAASTCLQTRETFDLPVRIAAFADSGFASA